MSGSQFYDLFLEKYKFIIAEAASTAIACQVRQKAECYLIYSVVRQVSFKSFEVLDLGIVR